MTSITKSHKTRRGGCFANPIKSSVICDEIMKSKVISAGSSQQKIRTIVLGVQLRSVSFGRRAAARFWRRKSRDDRLVHDERYGTSWRHTQQVGNQTFVVTVGALESGDQKGER
ncbi:hypothetical protein ElyMa_004500900 [Elysia marginata]|uniref:Uncharacterized protein n=1 Tax=Elysia marginata TaxID=1093978 RepID=A0AAV4HPB5_9GAST|nr:hypothetical protein ElyMa_004500900 [Elysia marginata]